MSSSKTCPQCGSAIPEGSPDGQCPRCMLRAGLGNEPEGQDGGKHFEGDRNLLFGVFAVQLRKVTPQEVMAAAGAWAADAAKDIPTRLREQNILSQADVEFIARLVDEAVRAHFGDVSAALHTLGGEQILQATYGNSVDLTRHRYGAAAGSPIYLDGAPLSPDSVPGVQETPGRYTHVSEHARGGMGRVLLVHDGFLGRNVALKELMPGQRPASDPENPSTPVRQYMGFLSRFLQEARITGQLEHPSIVPVYELGHRQDGTLYYTMKLVRGKTLREAIKQSKTVQERLALLAHFVDLCQAIAYAHSRGIIHRDIKPDNVMVGEFGETVVLDWGLAKAKDKEDVHADGLAETIRMLQLGDVDSALKTQYGQVMGTPGYMAPEQALGRMTDVDERSDVYSLGTVLYQMLAGRPPFTGKSVPEILQKVVDDEPEPLDAKTVPPELAAICMKAMEKRADDRYATASAMADEVRRFQTGAIVQAYSYGFGHHLRRFATKHKAVLTTSAAALLVLLALAGYSYVNIRQARDVAETKRIEAEAAKTESDKQRNAANAARDAEESARERAEHAAYVAGIGLAKANFDAHNMAAARRSLLATPAHLRNWEWGYLYNAIDTCVFTLPGVNQATYSPGGNYILALHNDGVARIWDANTGKIRTTLFGHTDSVLDASYSPDGKHIATASADNTARIFEAETGAELHTLAGHTDLVFLSAFSPDGSRVLTVASDGSAKGWDPVTGKLLYSLAIDSDRYPTVIFSMTGSRVLINTADWLGVWDCKTGRQFLNKKFEELKADISPDGSQVVASFSSEKDGAQGTKLFDANTGEEMFSLSEDPCNVLAFSSDGSQILANIDDDESGRAMVWDARTGKELFSLSHVGTTVTFRQDGMKILAAYDDGMLRIWDVQTGKDPITLKGHESLAVAAEFSKDRKRIVTASLDNTAKVWDAETGKELLCLEGHSEFVTSANFSLDGNHILTISRDDSAKVWSARPNRADLNKSRSVFVSFSPDGSRVCSTRNHTAVVWDVNTGREIHTLSGHTGPVMCSIFSPDGQRILTISDDTTGRIWDATTGVELLRLATELNIVRRVQFRPDGARILTSGYGDCPARTWDAHTGRELLTLDTPPSESNALNEIFAQFSPDGKRILLLLRRDNKVLRLVDSETGKDTLILHSDKGVFASAGFSPDGTRIVTRRWEAQTAVWDASSGRQLFTLTDEENSQTGYHEYFCPSFSPDGTRICDGVAGNVAKVWDAISGQELLTLTGHTDRVVNTEFSPDGKRILTQSEDKTVRLWDFETGDELPWISATFDLDLDLAAAFSPDGRHVFIPSYNPEGFKRIWSAAPWRPEDWLDDTMRTELVRLALRNAPEVHETTLDRAKGEIEPALNSLSALATALAANINKDIRGLEGQGVYFQKAPPTAVPSIPIANEDVIVSVDAQLVNTADALSKSVNDFVTAARGNIGAAHTLNIEIVNRYDRDFYAITIPAVAAS